MSDQNVINSTVYWVFNETISQGVVLATINVQSSLPAAGLPPKIKQLFDTNHGHNAISIFNHVNQLIRKFDLDPTETHQLLLIDTGQVIPAAVCSITAKTAVEIYTTNLQQRLINQLPTSNEHHGLDS